LNVVIVGFVPRINFYLIAMEALRDLGRHAEVVELYGRAQAQYTSAQRSSGTGRQQQYAGLPKGYGVLPASLVQVALSSCAKGKNCTLLAVWSPPHFIRYFYFALFTARLAVPAMEIFSSVDEAIQKELVPNQSYNMVAMVENGERIISLFLLQTA
jgi:hypothetical protein